MEKLYLEIPSLCRKKEALDYLEENKKYKSEFNGTGGLEKFLDGMSYEDWLLELESKENIEYVQARNACLSKTFFVIN